jgi:hypothetical protein
MKHIRRALIVALAAIAGVLLLCGPAATWLQSRHTWITPSTQVDAVYIVCGARAQTRRVTALTDWLSHSESHAPRPTILVGNDPQKSLWCRQHQTNHTVTAWTQERLTTMITSLPSPPPVVPGTFRNTDGEMVALSAYLQEQPEIQSIALVTSRFHARRCLQRFHTHAETQTTTRVIPGIVWWENRAPWIVAGELLKMVRDNLHLSDVITRTERDL